MGILDRDYYREEPRSSLLGGDRSMVANLIIINVALYLIDALFFDGWLMFRMGLSRQLFQEPWNVWQLVTYGFAHSPGVVHLPGGDVQFTRGMWHIVFNMLGLWFFGREVEGIYGKKVFFQLYLSLIVLSGFCWLLTVFHNPAGPPLIGASGGVVGVMLVYILHYPYRTILVYGVLPVRAWLFMAFYVFQEFYSLSAHDYVAHAAHLGGALFGFVFYKTGWTLFTLLPGKLLKRGIPQRRPKLKLHAPEQDDELLSQRVDEILEKISREGEASLTKDERRVLEDASRRYQKRRS